MKHSIVKLAEKLLTKKDSYIMIRQYMKNRIITIIDLKIQL